MGLWLPTCRRLTFNKRGASTTQQWSRRRTARESGTASTLRTPTRPQRSSARVVKWRGALPRNTPSPNDAAGDGNIEGTSRQQPGRGGRPPHQVSVAASLSAESAQYLLGALQLKLEASCWVLRLPHSGQAGGRFFRRSCSVIAMLISKRLPQDWHSNS